MEFVFRDGAPDPASDAGDVWIETLEVPETLRYLEGHFPGNPIVPGVAQVVAIGEERARHVWKNLGPSLGLRRLKFMEALRPGHILELRLQRRTGSPIKIGFSVRRGDHICSKGTLLFGAT